MSTTTTPKPEPRTAADARREFACSSEPARRRHRQVPGQGTIYGQASLLDCIADCPLPAIPIPHDPERDAATMLHIWQRDYNISYTRIASGHIPAVHLSAFERNLDWEPARVWAAASILWKRDQIKPAYWAEKSRPKHKRGYHDLGCASIFELVLDPKPRKRREIADGAFITLPEVPGPFHCLRCGRPFPPGELNCFTGYCDECDRKTAFAFPRVGPMM